MKFAIKEILHGKKKFLLIEILIILMLFMVLFLSGLAEGLARAVSSAVDNMDAEYFILSDDAEELMTVSVLDHTKLQEIYDILGDKAEPLCIQRSYINSSDKKLDIVYIAVRGDGFLAPDITEGKPLKIYPEEISPYPIFEADYADGIRFESIPVILNSGYKAEGIKVGDIITDSATGLQLMVAGFTEDRTYGHVGTGYISITAFQILKRESGQSFDGKVNALAFRSGDYSESDLRLAMSKVEAISGIEFIDKNELIESLPSYKAEQTTINMIVWVLVIISSAVVGVFYYIITLQKERQFGIMKAVGLSTKKVSATVLSGILIITISGALIANILTFAMAAALPDKMPFYLTVRTALLDTAVFIIVSLLAGLLSVKKAASADPVTIIGG